MQPRIVFLVMSAVSKPETVDQLAHALAPHTVLVHHDFSQTPDFPLTAENVVFVPDFKRTGWAFFGFVDGIFHSLRYALSHLDFDYLQLLSPTCLPIKPMAQFEASVASGVQAHFDCVDLMEDPDALWYVGYRAFTPEHSLRHRLVRRAVNIYFGSSSGRRDEAGIWLRSGGGKGLLAWSAALLIKGLCRPSRGHPVFNGAFHPYYGTAWFGARREIVAGMVDLFARPGFRDYFSHLRIPEEFLFPSLLMHLVTRKGPMNHVVKKYNEARTGTFEIGDMALLRASGAFLARKFPDDPASPLRLQVLSELVGVERSLAVAAAPVPSLQPPASAQVRPISTIPAPAVRAPSPPGRVRTGPQGPALGA